MRTVVDAAGAARTRRALRRSALTAAAVAAALVTGLDLGGLHAPEMSTKLVVAALGVVFVVCGVLTAREIAGQVAHAAGRAGAGAGSMAKPVCQLAGYAIVFVATLALLTIPLQQVLVGGALTGVILGIAAQQPLSNVIAGLVVLFVRPLRIGQQVRIHSGALGGPPEGRVREIGLIYTSLEAGAEIVQVPNAGLLGAAIRAGDPHGVDRERDR